MLQMLLELFTTPQKAEAMLESPIIELIFMALFGLFILVIITHSIIFLKIKATRDYVKRTKRMDIEPLQSIKLEFEARQQNEAIKLDTFIQEVFELAHTAEVPVVNLIKLVQMTISVFILLGVLGTFIGLTISLGNISTAGDQLVENVAAVLSGIDVAFYTSIIGMGFSLVMTLLIRLFNAEYLFTDLMLIVESQLESRKQHGLNRMIAVSEMIHDSIQSLEETNKSSLGSIVEAFAGFKNYTEGLQQSAEDLAKFNDGLSKNLEDFDELFRQMSLVTDGFSEGTNQLNENFSSLFTYFEHVDRNNERMTNSITRTAEKVEDVSDAQIKSLQGFDQSVTELKTFTAASLKGQEESLRSLEKINRQTGNLADTIGTQTTVMQNIFGDDLSIRLSNISTYLADLKKGFDLASNSIVALPGALEVISQTQKDHYHLLGDRFRELERFNEIFGEHLRNYGADAAALENHLREAAATFKMLSEKTITQSMKYTAVYRIRIQCFPNAIISLHQRLQH